MDILFFLLFLLCVIALIIGLINPNLVIRWGSPSKRNRKKVLKIYVTVLILLYIIFSSSIDTFDSTEELLEAPNSFESNHAGKDNLEVHFIDVGQADSILITTGSDAMLIDAGENEDGDLVVDYIKSLGISDLDYVIGTHPHEDHIGGLDDVINTFDVGKVLMPKKESTTKTFEDVLLSIQNKGIKVTTPKVGAKYNLGQAEWTILAPSQEYEETNNSSIVIRLIFGDNSFMFTGDAEEKSEKEILKTGDLNSDLLKVGHHGSISSTSIDFLKQVNPTYAVISVGKDNRYGHPHKEIIERLTEQNVEILRTDELGTIILTSDGNDLNYEIIKNSENVSNQ